MSRLGRKAESEIKMLEAGEKPRPRLKNKLQRTALLALAGFFALMLAFTLVSWIADSITVAKVKADTIKSGVLTERVTLNGLIESLGDMPLDLPGGIPIISAKVSVGQQVNAGDVLLELDEDEIAKQLSDLKDKLKLLELRHEAATSGASGGSVNDAKRALAQAEEDLKRLESKLNRTVQRAEEDLQEAEVALNDAKTAYQQALAEAENDTNDPAVQAAQKNVDAAQKALKAAKRALEDSRQSRDDQIIAAKRAIETAKNNLDQARQNEEKGGLQAEADRLAYVSDKRVLEASIAEFEKIAAAGGMLVSPIDGSVLSITESGKTQDGVPAAAISRSDLGFSFTAKLDQNEAEKLYPGAKGQLAYSFEGKSNEVEAIITSIGAADDKGEVTVTASLPDGSYTPGAAGEMTWTQRSEMQSTCLPISALRSDSSGDYVLVMREKKTVMGLEYTVTRVPVTVLARDSELMSIDSTLLKDDLVVVSSNKPIAEGDRVRLETD